MQQRNLPPRDLSDKYGHASLEDHDLWALILRSGTKKQSVYSLTKQLTPFIHDSLFNGDSSNRLLEKISKNLTLGDAQRHVIVGVYELLLRQTRAGELRQAVTRPELIATRFHHLKYKRQEYVYCVYLTPRLTIVNERLITKGTTDAVLVDVRDVLYYGIKYRTRHFIVVHNHPSGVSEPSVEDIEQTKRIHAASQLLSMTFVDHIIISRQGYYSFKESQCVL